jgi:hypothetical protein
VKRLVATTGLAVLVGVTGCLAYGWGSPAYAAQVGAAAPVVTPAPATPRVLMNERFAGAWPDHPGGTAWLGDAGYQLYAREPGHCVAVRAPLAEVPGDVVLSATFRKVGGPPGGGYGLIVRDQRTSAGDGADQAGDFVVAGISDRGEAGLWRRSNGAWVDLMPWTPTRAAKADGGTNELTVTALGSRIGLAVNGTPVGSVDVPVLRGGGVGVYAGGDLNRVQVERFSVQEPGRPAVDARSGSQAVVPTPLPAPRSTSPAPGIAAPPTGPPQTTPPVATGPRGRTPTAGEAMLEAGRVRDLIASMFDDVLAIFETFADGFDSPRSPINNQTSLREASGHLNSATAKAYQVLAELQRIHAGDYGGYAR